VFKTDFTRDSPRMSELCRSGRRFCGYFHLTKADLYLIHDFLSKSAVYSRFTKLVVRILFQDDQICWDYSTCDAVMLATLEGRISSTFVGVEDTNKKASKNGARQCNSRRSDV
jgi:hypothetical protein